MPDAENKVQFGLKNVYYAVWDGEKYLTPVAVPGAVNLNLAAEGELQKFYADDVEFWTSNNNKGYSGDIEFARVHEKMLQDVWGLRMSETSKVLTEYANVEPKKVALLYEISGDATGQKYCLYSVAMGRPNIGSKTTGENKDPTTQTCSLAASPLAADGRVYSRTTTGTPKEVRDNWYKMVYEETEAA